MTNQNKPFDKSPWTVWAHGAGYSVYSSDFTHDVRLEMTGDFESFEQAKEYAESLASVLNNASKE